MKILDFTSFCAAEDVKNLLYQHWLGLCAQDITPSHYYCGITNDPDRRKEQHESELGKTIKYLCVCKCASSEIAGEVEELMAKKGFNIGDVDFDGNGRTDDSVYVYLFEKYLIIKQHDSFQNIYITDDASIYIVKYDEEEVILSFTDSGFDNQKGISKMPDVIKNQVEMLQQNLVEDKYKGIETEIVEERELEPFDPNTIDIEKKVVTMETIIRRLEQKTIKLNPDFQRKEVWNLERKCQLIESLLLRIPIPLFYVSSSFDDSWTVVDGLQRLSTIRDFILGQEYLKDKEKNREKKEHGFKLEGLEFCGSILNGKDMHGLPTTYYNRIMETEFTFVIIKPGTPEDVKRNIFKRINTGGLQLSSQEIRNALYSGFSTQLLSSLSESEEFKAATDWSVKTLRMEDKELILRLLAFFIREYDKYSKSYNIDTWLSDSMIILNSIPELKNRDFLKLGIDSSDVNILSETQIVERFSMAMNRSKSLFGSHSFRKSVEGERRSPINKTLFEMWGVLLSSLTEQQFYSLMSSKSNFIEDYRNYLKDSDFIQAISRDSMKKSSVQYRYSKMNELIKKHI